MTNFVSPLIFGHLFLEEQTDGYALLRPVGS